MILNFYVYVFFYIWQVDELSIVKKIVYELILMFKLARDWRKLY